MNYIQRKVLTIEIFLPNIFLQSVIMGLSVNTNLGPCIKIKLGSLRLISSLRLPALELSFSRQTLLFIIIITDSNLSYYYQNYFAFTLFTLEAFPAISAPDSLVAIGTIL